MVGEHVSVDGRAWMSWIGRLKFVAATFRIYGIASTPTNLDAARKTAVTKKQQMAMMALMVLRQLSCSVEHVMRTFDSIRKVSFLRPPAGHSSKQLFLCAGHWVLQNVRLTDRTLQPPLMDENVHNR